MPPETDDTLGFGDFFSGLDDQQGLSLEDLSKTYAEMLGVGEAPYAGEPRDEAAEEAVPPDLESLTLEPDPDLACEISPRSILEALLFVGHPENHPLTARLVASLMRGVRPQEIDDLVRELNEQYAAEGSTLYIASVGAGYVMQLRDDWGSLRDKFYGRVKESRLTQAAIDVLAIIAYKQGLSRDEVERLRNKPSGAVLSQLVRRELLEVRRKPEEPKVPRYYTTERFLDLFDLDDVASLPDSQELE